MRLAITTKQHNREFRYLTLYKHLYCWLKATQYPIETFECIQNRQIGTDYLRHYMQKLPRYHDFWIIQQYLKPSEMMSKNGNKLWNSSRCKPHNWEHNGKAISEKQSATIHLVGFKKSEETISEITFVVLDHLILHQQKSAQLVNFIVHHAQFILI